MLEVLSVDRAIIDKIKNDPELQTLFGGPVKAFADTANEDEADKDWIVFELFTGTDSRALGGYHVLSRPQYLIKVCNRGRGYQACRPIAERVNYLLTNEHHGEYDGVWVGKFVRSQVMRGSDNVKDVMIYWVGQLYDLIAHGV